MQKPLAESFVVMSQIMLPSQANFEGNIHGGEVIKLMDTCAYAAARLHAQTNIVTARVDEVEFFKPIYIGEMVICKAQLIFVGRTSLLVSATVDVQNLDSGEPPQQALHAYFTMVALDKEGRPTPVPPLIINTPEERKIFDEGRKRYEMYKSLMAK